MKPNYRITEAASRLHSAGISYTDYGVLTHDGVELYNYYKVARVTGAQIAKLREYCPDMQVIEMQSTHAPEIKRVALCFPKAAWYRQKHKSK